jgi:hypothetical protein
MTSLILLALLMILEVALALALLTIVLVEISTDRVGAVVAGILTPIALFLACVLGVLVKFIIENWGMVP